MKIENILFPVDFSLQSQHVAPPVIELAQHFRACLTLLNTWQLAADIYGAWGWAMPDALDISEVEEPLLGALQDFREKSLSPLPDEQINIIIRQSEPSATIARTARERNIDLIMMPTHGYGGFRRALLGSVTAKVLHDSDCPVWTTAHALHSTPSTPGYKTILCALGNAPDREREIRLARSLGQEFDAQVHFVYALEFVGDPALQARLWPERKERALQSLHALIGDGEPAQNTAVESGGIVEVVTRHARDLHADLLVIGRGHSTSRLGSLRSHASAIIRESPCPVWSI